MELDILKHFVKHEVEVLVSGVWIEGLMMPISKSVVVLLPLGDAQAFYGPTSLKAEVIQAIRQVKRNNAVMPDVVPTPPVDPNIRSSLEDVTAKQRFSRK